MIENSVVFAPKYRRKVIYGKIKKDIGEIIRKLCEQKGVEIIEAEACKDHIHLLVSILPYISVAQFMGYLKGKSTLMIFDRVGLSMMCYRIRKLHRKQEKHSNNRQEISNSEDAWESDCIFCCEQQAGF